MTEQTLVRRLDGRAQFFDEAPLDASRSNLRKSADLFREAAREIERLSGGWQEAIEVAREPTAAMLDAMQAECPEIGRHYLRAIWRAGFAALQPSVAEPTP